jgi:hypothetical protein
VLLFEMAHTMADQRPNSQVASLADLQAAIESVADVISRLSADDWRDLCRQENAAVCALAQSFEEFGPPTMGDTRGPELIIGEMVVDILCERHKPPC